MKIKVGDQLPNFEMPNQNGEIVSLESLKGQKFLLFFYPKDDSPGCTKEACSIRDNYRKISKAGYKVFGVSPDTPKKHLKFIDKYEFQYDLLSDEDKVVLNSYGLWGPKKFMGREIIGVYRTTILVDENGVIEEIIEKVKTKIHGEQILEAMPA